jgi:hypothetical protein
MDLLISICLGLGLAASCGFRIFVPMLGLSIAAMSGHLHLASGFEWIGTTPALVCFSVATVLEIAAFYVPWIDNALDTIAIPAAVVAGSLLTASVVTEMSPLLKWSVAIIAGGGLAGMIQAGTALIRGTSTASTGGSGNFVVATVELIGALLGTLLAILLPVLSLIAVCAIVFYILLRFLNRPPKPITMHSKAGS